MQFGEITLPDSLEWVDEYDWSAIKQDKQYTIGGTLIVSESTITKGRPLTLIGGENVWVKKSVVDALYALVNTVNGSYTLTLPDGRAFNVMFDRDNNPIEARPVWRKNVHGSDDDYTLTLKLMEVL